ncbi:MAG: PEGA domain-containing protein [Candidatus Aminicenantes bacterium]|nr:PEGA domain-containing protein [Candidatus Aminicenantes bacterium]
MFSLVRGKDFFPGLLIFCLLSLLFQSCLFTKKQIQTIPVTSRPEGAKITVDGKEVGPTPLNLKLESSREHTILIEKAGYQSVRIQVETNKKKYAGHSRIKALTIGPMILAAGMCLGGVIGNAIGPRDFPDHLSEWTFWGALVGAIPGLNFIIVNLSPSSWAGLEPESIYVILKPLEAGDSRLPEEKAQTIVLTTEQLKNLRWIRIVEAERDSTADNQTRLQ